MSSPHRFVVRGQVYTPPDAAGVRRVLPEKHERVATFPKAEAAFGDCAKRLAEFRRATNPFQLGGTCLFYQTNLPAFAFHDYLLDHGLTPPPTSLTANPNYVFWWVRNNRTFTDRQREVVWSACDKLKPFDVMEEDDRKAVHVVVRDVVVPWPGAERHCWDVLHDGGLILKAFHSTKDARRATKVLDDRTRAEFDRVEQEDEARYPSFHQVLVVQGPVEKAATCELVLRQSYGGEHGTYALDGSEPARNLGARRPVVAFNDPLQAALHEKQLRETARRKVNPFALCWGTLEVDLMWLQAPDEEEAGCLPNGLTFTDAFEAIARLPTVPPAPEVLTAEWYDRVVQWSPEFIDVIWSTFADFRLFEVIEVPLG